MKIMRKIANWIGGTFLVSSILLLLAVLCAPLFGWNAGTVVSGSMEPTLKVGALAISRTVDPEDVKVGDIITFIQQGEDSNLICHRVVEVEEDESLAFRTKGDACEDVDLNIVSSNDVKGQIVFHIPLVGYYLNVIKSPLGAVLLLILPGLIIVNMEVRNIRRAYSKMKRNKRLSKEQI